MITISTTSQNWRKKKRTLWDPTAMKIEKMKRNYYELYGKNKSIKENQGRDQSYENET
jgi:hypothetical protein